MLDKKFLKDARSVFKEIQDSKEEFLTPEEEAVFRGVAERLNVEYEQQQERKNEERKPVRKTVSLDEKTLTFANQTLLLRAIMSNNMAYRESLSEFVKNLIMEEWKRLMAQFEAIQDQMEKESAQTKNKG